MPFKSKAQRSFLYAKHPEIAKEWSVKYDTPKNLPEHAKKKSAWLSMGKKKGGK